MTIAVNGSRDRKTVVAEGLRGGERGGEWERRMQMENQERGGRELKKEEKEKTWKTTGAIEKSLESTSLPGTPNSHRAGTQWLPDGFLESLMIESLVQAPLGTYLHERKLLESRQSGQVKPVVRSLVAQVVPLLLHVAEGDAAQAVELEHEHLTLPSLHLVDVCHTGNHTPTHARMHACTHAHNCKSE